MRDVIRLGMLGCGTVGTGVLRVLAEHAADVEARLGAPVEVRRVAVRDATRPREALAGLTRGALVTEDAGSVVEAEDVDIVVEVMGGYEPARTLVLRALGAGKHVVTANKALLARHGPELFKAAQAAGRDLMFEAAVGGGIPVIRTLREALASDRVEEVAAILNGTSNFLLSAMDLDGAELPAALAEAQARGFAEADPTMDVAGTDAAQKLSILVALAFGTHIPYEDIHTEGLGQVAQADIALARHFGYRIKPLALARRHAAGVEARVQPVLVPAAGMLGNVHGVFNAVHLRSRALGPSLLYGRGAGMLPTAASVVSDVIEVARVVRRDAEGGGDGAGRLPPLAFYPGRLQALPPLPHSDARAPFYLRFAAPDRPGVLASIAGILGDHGVSIHQMIQRGGAEPVDVAMITHAARAGDVDDALAAVDAAALVLGPTRRLAIEEAL